MKRSAVQKAFTTAAAVCLLAVAAFSAWQVYGILHATSTAKKAYSEITQQAAPQQQASAAPQVQWTDAQIAAARAAGVQLPGM